MDDIKKMQSNTIRYGDGPSKQTDWVLCWIPIIEYDQISRTAVELETNIINYTKVNKRCWMFSVPNNQLQAHLNKHDLWEQVVETLEKNCIKREEKKDPCTTKYSGDRSKKEIHYTLPVLKFDRLTDVDDINATQISNHPEYTSRSILHRLNLLPQSCFIFNYQRKFEPLPSFKLISKNDLPSSIQRLTDSKNIKINVSYQTNKKKKQEQQGDVCLLTLLKDTATVPSFHYRERNIIDPEESKDMLLEFVPTVRNQPTPEQRTVKHITIDLQRNRPITHVSTLGSKCTYDSYTLKNGLDDMYVAADIRPDYITSYQLQVRSDKGREWIHLGTFAGNTNRFTEVIHPLQLSFMVRYIRLVPKQYSGLCSAQIGLFINTKEEGTEQELIKEETMNKTVVYVLKDETNGAWQKKKFMKSRVKKKSHAKVFLGDEIQEGIDQYYDEYA